RSELAILIIDAPHRPLLDFLPCLELLNNVSLQDISFIPGSIDFLPRHAHNRLMDELLSNRRQLTWADLSEMTTNSLLKLPGMGSRTVQATVEFLVDIGLQLDHRVASAARQGRKQEVSSHA